MRKRRKGEERGIWLLGGFGFALERAYEASKNHMVERIAAAFVVETTE